MLSIFIVLAFSTIVIAIVSAIVASIAFVTSSTSFAFVAAVVVSLKIVKSSGEGLERLLKLDLKGFDFIRSWLDRFNPSDIDFDCCIKLLHGHGLELRAFGIDEGFSLI